MKVPPSAKFSKFTESRIPTLSADGKRVQFPMFELQIPVHWVCFHCKMVRTKPDVSSMEKHKAVLTALTEAHLSESPNCRMAHLHQK